MRNTDNRPSPDSARSTKTTILAIAIIMLTPPASGILIEEPVTGTQLVEGEETWTQGPITVDHDLIVGPGGHLILDGVTVNIDQGASIIVLAGGNLTILDSDLDIKAEDDPGWGFQVLGSLFVDESRIAHADTISVRGLAHITGSEIIGNVDHGVHTERKGISTLEDNLFARNALDPDSATAGAIVTTDATLVARDNVVIGNGGFGFRTVSTLAGARVFGPAIATIEHNVLAHHAGAWAMHFQEFYNSIHQVENNLVYGNPIGVNVQSTNDQMATRTADNATGKVVGSMFSGNALVNNTVAAVNHGFVGSRDGLDDVLDPTASLADSWVPVDDPEYERDNEIFGPWDASGLVDKNPVPELWDRLYAAENATGIDDRAQV